MNASVLIFSRLFTNSTIPEFDPNVMSNLINSILGISVYMLQKNDKVKWFVGIFAIEKNSWMCLDKLDPKYYF
jgi:hypothetical protein